MTGAAAGSGPVTTPRAWFVRLEERPEAGLRLYVLPHAGAGPSAAGALAARLPDSVETWALSLPGRQARREEPSREDLGPLVEEIAADLSSSEGEHALFGYCGGALLAYLVARRSAPRHLVVASFAAPDVALVPRRLHRLPSDLFRRTVLDQGGVAPDLASHDELWPLFEPAIRADFALYAGHRRVTADPLDVPITVLRGTRDPDLGLGALLGWRRFTVAGPPVVREVDAGHWLVDERPDEVADLLAESLCVGRRDTSPTEVSGRAR